MCKIIQYKLRLVKDRVFEYPVDTVGNYDNAKIIACHMLKGLPHEEMICIYVNGCNKLIGTSIIAMGGMHGVAVSPRDVFRGAIAANASAIILAHNHPSGDPQPSGEDVLFTRKILEAANILGTLMLDHLVIAGEQAVSMREFMN